MLSQLKLVTGLVALSAITVVVLVARSPGDNPPKQQSSVVPEIVAPPEQLPHQALPAGSSSPRTRQLSPALEGPIAGIPPEDPDSWKHAVGYSGPFFNPDSNDGRVVVLEQTVTTDAGPTWGALGLVRNQTDSSISITGLKATLLDAEHREVGTVAASLPISYLRSGEPGPFVATSLLPTSSVASVRWEATYSIGGDATLQSRSYDLQTSWDRPYGTRERVEGPPFHDPQLPPFPYLLLGSIRNIGTSADTEVQVIGAWLDDHNRVVHIERLPIRPFSDYLHDHAQVSLAQAQAADFAYANGDSILGPRLTNAELALWGVGR